MLFGSLLIKSKSDIFVNGSNVSKVTEKLRIWTIPEKERRGCPLYQHHIYTIVWSVPWKFGILLILFRWFIPTLAHKFYLSAKHRTSGVLIAWLARFCLQQRQFILTLIHELILSRFIVQTVIKRHEIWNICGLFFIQSFSIRKVN